MTTPFTFGTVDAEVVLIALAISALCTAFSAHTVPATRIAWVGAVLIVAALALNLGRFERASLGPGAVLPAPAWFLLVSVGALSVVAHLFIRTRTNDEAAPERLGLSFALAFAALGSLAMGASATSLVSALVALELSAAAAYAAAIVYGRAQPRSVALPLAGVSLAILVGECAGAALIIGSAGSSGFDDLAGAFAAAGPGAMGLGVAVLLAAWVARVLWIAACYGVAIRHDRSGSVHLVMGVLVWPAGLLGGAHLIALGGMSLAPAFSLGAQLGIGAALLLALRTLTSRRDVSQAIAWTAIVSGLTVLFAALLLGPEPGSSVFVLTLQMMLAICVLALAAAAHLRDPQSGLSLSAAGFIGLAGLAVAGLPPFLGFWGRWSLVTRLLESGPVEIVALIFVVSLAMVITWVRLWFGFWSAALAQPAVPITREGGALATGLAAFFLTVLALLSVWPAPVVGAMP